MAQKATTSSAQGYLLTVLGLMLVSVGLGVGGQIAMLFHVVAIGFFVAAIVVHVRARKQGKQPETEKR
jgi:hypothetical protein